MRTLEYLWALGFGDRSYPDACVWRIVDFWSTKTCGWSRSVSVAGVIGESSAYVCFKSLSRLRGYHDRWPVPRLVRFIISFDLRLSILSRHPHHHTQFSMSPCLEYFRSHPVPPSHARNVPFVLPLSSFSRHHADPVHLRNVSVAQNKVISPS